MPMKKNYSLILYHATSIALLVCFFVCLFFYTENVPRSSQIS